MEEKATIAVLNKARQIGFSHTTAGIAVYDALTQGSDNIVLSASQELSSEVLDKAKLHSRVLTLYGYDEARTVSENASRITFPNGGRVIALPSNPRTARSFTGNVHFDEAAYHVDFKSIWDAAAAMSTRLRSGPRFKIRVISTPNGAQGLFYDWISQPPKGWAVHQVTIDQAQRDGMKVNIPHLWELAGHDERVFAQWYRCAFLDAQMQYIPTALVDRAYNWVGKVPDIRNVEIYGGLDIGRTNDLTALTIVAVVDGVAYIVAIMTCARTKFKAQKRMIEDAREMFQWYSLHVDQTGMGREMAEELVDEFGDDEVFPIDFTNLSKADLVTRAMKWFRDNRIRFPRDQEGKKLRNETITVQRIVTPAGNVVYDTPRTTETGHGDRFWSLCLALKGAGDPPQPGAMGQVPLFAVP